MPQMRIHELKFHYHVTLNFKTLKKDDLTEKSFIFKSTRHQIM